MRLWSDTFRDGRVLPARYAFAELAYAPDEARRVVACSLNPALALTLKK